MLDKIVENEIVDSFKKNLRESITSPIYGIFIISWLIVHWKFIFTMFFVSGDKILEKTSLLKHEYLEQNFFDISTLEFWILNIIPFIVTWLSIWILPKIIAIPAFKKNEEQATIKKIIRLVEQRKLEEAKVRKLDVITEKIKKEKEITTIDPSLNWQNEYINFQKTPNYSRFKFIVDSIYKHNGLIRRDSQGFEIPNSILIYAHTSDLITLDQEKKNVELTEKGKFFVKQFSSDRYIS